MHNYHKSKETHVFNVGVTLSANILNGREIAEEILEARLGEEDASSDYSVRIMEFQVNTEEDQNLTYLTKEAANLRLHAALGWLPLEQDTYWYHPDYQSYEEYTSEEDFTRYVDDLNAVRELVITEIIPLGLGQQYHNNIRDIINEDCIAQTGYDVLDLMTAAEMYYMIAEASAYLRVLAIIRTLETYHQKHEKTEV